jgi:AraC-like DNA-binding protein
VNGDSPKLPSFYRYFPLSQRDRKWGLCVTTVGTTRIGQHAPYPPPGHPKGYDFAWSRGRVLHDYQIVYISRGRGWFESRQIRRRLLEAGSVFLLFPGVWHRYMPDPDTGWEEHWVGFEGDMPRRWARHHFFSPHDPIIEPTQEELVLTLFTRLIDAVKTNQPALQQVMAGIVGQLLGLLYSAQQARLTGQRQSALAIQQAIERLQSDLTLSLDLPELARKIGVSYSWLRRTFTEHTGLSPHQYLLELRLVRARNLLAQTALSVKQIARQTGCEDEHYFCRLFRRKTGMTPTQWRNRTRKKD